MIPTRYTFSEVIGEGEFGVIHRGFDLETQKKIAIKEINIEDCSKKSSYVNGLEDLPEYKYYLHKVPEHPNLLQYHDVFTHDGCWYLVMDYLEGEDLMSIIMEDPIGMEKFVQIIYSMVEAIDHLAKHGVCHRDIKPENIMLTEDGRVVLVDMGLACFRKDPTSYKNPAGTANYASPQVISGGSLDWETWIPNDIWSLGITLCTAINQELPFDDEDRHVLYDNIKNLPHSPVFDPHDEDPDLLDPVLVNFVISRMLAKEADKRAPLQWLLEKCREFPLFHELERTNTWNVWMLYKYPVVPTCRSELIEQLDKKLAEKENVWYRRWYRKIFSPTSARD